jgi:hypothetical protein
MTAAELELVVALELEKVGADRGVLEELGRRARAVERCEGHMPALNRARGRTRDAELRRALEVMSELVMLASPARRRILRDLKGAEVSPAG